MDEADSGERDNAGDTVKEEAAAAAAEKGGDSDARLAKGEFSFVSVGARVANCAGNAAMAAMAGVGEWCMWGDAAAAAVTRFTDANGEDADELDAGSSMSDDTGVYAEMSNECATVAGLVFGRVLASATGRSSPSSHGGSSWSTPEGSAGGAFIRVDEADKDDCAAGIA